MYIKQIKLKNFKNFISKEIELNKGLNIIVGEHATGKSTIIDAIRFVIDPQLETSSQNLNLHCFKYQPPNSTIHKTGYVELSFFCRNVDCKIINVRRDFSNLDLVKIDGQQVMKIRKFYIFLRSRNFCTNSFMSSFIDLELLYKFDNSVLFKIVDCLKTELTKLHADIKNLVSSSNNIITTHLKKLTDYPKYHFSSLSDNETELINHIKSLTVFNKYIYNLENQRNIHGFLQCESDKLCCLEELQNEYFDIHEMEINNLINLTENISVRMQSSLDFVDLNQYVQKIQPLLATLHRKIKELSTDLNNFVSYPIQLDAQQQINKYVMNLRSTLKMKSAITRSIESDLEFLNELIIRKRSNKTKLIQSIESNVSGFERLKSLIESSAIFPDAEDDIAIQPFKFFVEFFLNDRLLYYKMELILCFEYHPTIINGLKLALTHIQDRRIIPVFSCIQFKPEFIIKENLYEYLKPILDWIIINDSAGKPFIIPEQLKSCNITWVPTRQLYLSSEFFLDTEFQCIWDGIDFETLHENEILTEHEKCALKFIFYQQQLKRQYETTLLSGGTSSHFYDIKGLCSLFQHFYQILTIRNDLQSYTHMFFYQTNIPIHFFKYKEHLDSIISSTNNLKNDFKMLLTIAEELQYHEEDINLKTMCLNQFNVDTEFNLVLKDFDLPHYKNNVDNIDKVKIKIKQLENISSQLNFKFNKMFLAVYLPLDDIVNIVPDRELRLREWRNWKDFIIEIQSELNHSKQLSEINVLQIAEVDATLCGQKNDFLTDDEEFSSLISGYESKTNNTFYSTTRNSFYQSLCEISESVAFLENVFCEVNRARKTIRKLNHITLINDVYTRVNLQIYDQVNNSIDVANQLLGNFNCKIKLSFSDRVDKLDDCNIDDCNIKGNKLTLLTSVQLIIQKKVNQYHEQSSMTSFITEFPTGSDRNFAKLMFILGVSLHNRHKLLTIDDISVILNKNPDLLINLSQLEEIYREQQIIMTCNSSEIILSCMNKINKYFRQDAEFDSVKFININI